MNDVWDRLDELSDEELATLVAAAEHVIMDEDEEAAEYVAMPVGAASARIAATLREEVGAEVRADAVAGVIRDRELALATLRVLAAEPVLADAVAEAYRRRRDMLAVDAGLLAVGALVLFVLKLKRIKIGKVDISFYEARAGLLEQLRELLGR